MSADHAPARELFDLTVQTTAVKGWSIADLASKSGVARSTIYGWRDNSGKPQAKSVNAVADALGIPRERALRLAGIIASPKPEPEPEIPQSLLREIETTSGLTEEERRAVIAAIRRTLAKGRGEAEAGGSGAVAELRAGPERHRPAS